MSGETSVPGGNHFGGFHVQTQPVSDLDAARAELAEEVRAMILEILTTQATPGEVRRVRDLVHEGVAALLAGAHGAAEGVGEAAIIERGRN